MPTIAKRARKDVTATRRRGAAAGWRGVSRLDPTVNGGLLVGLQVKRYSHRQPKHQTSPGPESPMSENHVQRRTFLTATAASIAGAALSGVPRVARAATPSPGTPVPSPATVKLGVASYSLRKFPREKAIEMIKTLRTPYVNFKSVHAAYESSPAE